MSHCTTSGCALAALMLLAACDRGQQAAREASSEIQAAQSSAAAAEAAASSAQASSAQTSDALARAAAPAAGTTAQRQGANDTPAEGVSIGEDVQSRSIHADPALRAKVDAAKAAGKDPARPAPQPAGKSRP